MPFTRVASFDDLWDGEMLPCTAEGARLLLIRREGSVTAFEDRCAHLGVPLSKGTLQGHVLTCSVHLWQYDVRTGQGINPKSACLKALPARVVLGEVLVDLSAIGNGHDAKHATDTGSRADNRTFDVHDHVGPVLEAGDVARAVILAIQKLNPEVCVQDRGSYLRVLARRSCTVTSRAIEVELGRPFALPGDLEQIMPSFKGVLTVSEDVVTWTWKGEP
jgi:toluene monooxygenase system ferredoxin subunit